MVNFKFKRPTNNEYTLDLALFSKIIPLPKEGMGGLECVGAFAYDCKDALKNLLQDLKEIDALDEVIRSLKASDVENLNDQEKQKLVVRLESMHKALYFFSDDPSIKENLQSNIEKIERMLLKIQGVVPRLHVDETYNFNGNHKLGTKFWLVSAKQYFARIWTN